MTSYSGDTFNVNDPGYSVTSYAASGVTNAATYTYSKITYFKDHVLKLEWYILFYFHIWILYYINTIVIYNKINNKLNKK